MSWICIVTPATATAVMPVWLLWREAMVGGFLQIPPQRVRPDFCPSARYCYFFCQHIWLKPPSQITQCFWIVLLGLCCLLKCKPSKNRVLVFYFALRIFSIFVYIKLKSWSQGWSPIVLHVCIMSCLIFYTRQRLNISE